MNDPILEPLNEQQRKAVTTTEGSLLILAGAGSGKTRVITHRFAYIVREKRLNPINILAVTFTNKAALEMKERISRLLGIDTSNTWIRTFHSTGLMLLRRHSELIFYPSDFIVYDDIDSKSIVKNILSELNFSKEKFPPGSISEKISYLKDRMILPEDFEYQIKSDFDEVTSKVYYEYEKILRKNKAVDFSDLIILPIKIFRENPSILENYHNLWRYIMVDEFQDTNVSQYELIKLLVNENKNICVVGDDDQSIYGWRGANIQNIYDFEERFNPIIIALEQNYRSTSIILEAANGVIKKLHRRMPKNLWTTLEGGEKIRLYEAYSEKEEAYWVVSCIQNLLDRYEYKDFAIFYRTNAQSRIFEEQLLFNNIPYKVFGGQKFYSRKEIKDILAYIKLIVNPDDFTSFERIIDVPKRGVGEITISKIRKIKEEENISLIDILTNSNEIERLNKRVAESLFNFGLLIKELNEQKEILTPTNLIKILLDALDYKNYLIKTEENGEERWENVEELINSIKVYETSNPNATIVDYISDITLQTSADEIEKDENRNYVSLMTLHNAKGLEFPVVFITGAVDGLLPHYSALLSTEEMGEERRLFYVGITRAKERLFISYSNTRLNYGHSRTTLPSPFIDDIPENCLEKEEFNEHRRSQTQSEPCLQEIPSNTSELQIGSRINHHIFGKGEVEFISDNIIVVYFDEYGKQILSKSNLKGLRILQQ